MCKKCEDRSAPEANLLFDNEPVLATFAYGHLPEPLQKVSQAFHELAVELVLNIPRSPERTIALRNLWDSKNYAVLAAAQEA